MVEPFIADLKDAVKEAMMAPSGKGTFVALYGMALPPPPVSLLSVTAQVWGVPALLGLPWSRRWGRHTSMVL
jgi:hypothetical protein